MKTSKKIMSVVIAVAMLMSTIAAVASFSSSAETVVFKWDQTNVKGDTWKTEGMYYGSWGDGIKPLATTDDEGNLNLQFQEKSLEDDYAKCAQLNLDCRTPGFVDNVYVAGTKYFVKITNKTSKAWKVMLNWSGDSNVQMLPPGKATEVEILRSDDIWGNEKTDRINFTVQTTTWPSGELQADFMTISPIYVEGDAPVEEPTQAPTEAPTTEEPTEAPTDAPTEAPTDAPTEAPAAEVVNDVEFPAITDGAASVSIDNVTAKTGAEVEVPVVMANNTGVNSGTFTFKYDPKVLEAKLNDKGNTDIVKGILTDVVTGPVKDREDGLKEIKVVWQTGSTDENISDNGILFSLKFTVVGAEGDKSGIAFTDFANDPIVIATDDGTEVVADKFGYKAATVEVVGEEEPTTEEPTEEPTGEEPTTVVPGEDTTTTVAGDDTTTAAGEDKTTAADDKTTAAAGDDVDVPTDNGSTAGDDVDTGSAAAPFAAVALAAGAAFVAFKARKK